MSVEQLIKILEQYPQDAQTRVNKIMSDKQMELF